MAVRDKQTEWRRVQIYRRMTPDQRLLIAMQMFEDGLQIVRESILDRQPDISEEDLRLEVRRRVLGRKLADLARRRP